VLVAELVGFAMNTNGGQVAIFKMIQPEVISLNVPQEACLAIEFVSTSPRYELEIPANVMAVNIVALPKGAIAGQVIEPADYIEIGRGTLFSAV